MSGTPAPAVFLSYASQDAAAAQRICEALRAAGAEVWFDQNELVGGDAWDAKIRKQIAACALFVPVISAATQARLEGYFRIEWKLAAQRTHAMADEKAFLLPVVIDATRDADAKVPVEFKAVQWTRLPGGETSEKFCARVKALLASDGTSGSASRPSSDSPASPGRRGETSRPREASWRVPAAAWGIAALGAVLAAGGYFWATRAPDSAPSRAPDAGMGTLPPAMSPANPAAAEKSVAVLAFANLSDDKANEHISDGLSEELLNVLGKAPGLRVMARTSSFHFKGKDTPISEIARQLGVAYVVEGSVRKAGNQVRVAARLLNASDGQQLWAGDFREEMKDVFALQDKIAGLIAENLSIKMALASRPARDIDPAAYQHYFAGRSAAAKAGMEDLKGAVADFESAVAVAPDFAAAWVQLAGAHTQLGRWGGSPTRQAWPAARAAIDRARALDPDSPDTLLAQGWIRRTAEWDWRGAEGDFRRALTLRPNHPETLSAAAVLLFNIGKHEEAFRLGRQAAQLDPLNASTQIDLSLMFFFSENWAEAERAARRALQLSPGGTGYQAILAWSLIAQRRWAEAEAALGTEASKIERLNGLGMLALARKDNAMTQECIARLDGLALADPDKADLQQSIAWLSASLGQPDRAFAALEKARASRDPSVAWSRTMWPLRPLHSDPRWNEFLRKLGLADEQLK